MVSPVKEREINLKMLTEMFGSEEEALEKYDEMVALAEEQKVQWLATQYQRDRKEEYPSIEEVTVALAEKAEGNSTMWDEVSAKRLDIKSKYPKTI
jgi:rubrerythrin